MTAAIRDLHLTNPGKFQTDVRTEWTEIWENNPWLTKLDDHDPEVMKINAHYPVFERANNAAVHFINGYHQYFEDLFSIRCRVQQFKGDLHFSDAELAAKPACDVPYWVISAGGKADFTTKWWPASYWQELINLTRGEIYWIHVGRANDYHQQLDGDHVERRVGQTNIRQLIHLVKHAEGVVSPITLVMHLAGALPHDDGRLRKCVVIAGGREAAHWEQYPGHRFLENVGSLDCNADGGCWRNRCQTMGDGHRSDTMRRCLSYSPDDDNIVYPTCMWNITPEMVAEAIKRS